MKNFTKDDWLEKIQVSGDWEGTPITYQYWSGFFMYEHLVDKYGSDKIIEIMLDFPYTKDFNKSSLFIFSKLFFKFSISFMF